HRLRGATVWLTGLSGSGKSTIADGVARELLAVNALAYVLDADNLRHGLNANLGFSDVDRSENVRRVGEVAKLFADAGVVAIVPIISPFAADRSRVRVAHEATGLDFIEVHVATSLAECERRDTKGLYAKVRTGEMRGVSGVDAPYEAPTAPDLVVAHDGEGVTESVRRVVEHLRQLGVLVARNA
ncbi:MAG: adenylyl-sulfate kinase, partial [Actinobacteria bacterium]|nr:adenylyl-sulfate kinase [Actinomycetota bacterium]